MKKLFLTILVILLMGGSILIGYAEAGPIKLRVGHDLPPFTTPGMGIDAWAKAVNERTEGRVVVEVYPAASLSEQKSGIDMLHAGVADVYMVSFSTHRPLFPVGVVGGLPGLGFPDTVDGHMAHANTLMALIEKYPVMANEVKDFKIIIDIINSNSILLSAKKEIRTPADLKGLKVGGTGSNLELFKMLGAAGVFDIPPQAYQKLQTGVIDATMIHFLATGEFKVYEVAKYALDISFGQAELPFMMSRKSWNKIPARDQQIIMDAALVGQKVAYKAAEERSIKGRQAMLDFGGTIVTPTPEERALWEKQFAVIWEKWVSDNEAAGVTNAREILNDWKSAANKAWGR